MRRDPGSITAGSDGPLPTGARSDRERERSDRKRDAERCGCGAGESVCPLYPALASLDFEMRNIWQ